MDKEKLGPSNGQGNWHDGIAALSGVWIGLIGAWLYLVGWTYVYVYFSHFRIPLLMLDISSQYILMYGVVVLREHAQWVAVGAVMVGLVFIFWPIAKVRISRRAQLTCAVFILLLFYWLGSVAAMGAAKVTYLEQREGDYYAFPRVQIELSADRLEQSREGLDARLLSDGCQRLVLENNNHLFLIRPYQRAPAADLAVLVLTRDAVLSLRILPDSVSCPQSDYYEEEAWLRQQCGFAQLGGMFRDVSRVRSLPHPAHDQRHLPEKHPPEPLLRL